MSSVPLRETEDTVKEDRMDTVMEEIDMLLAGSPGKDEMEMQPSLLSPKAVKENLEAPHVEVASQSTETPLVEAVSGAFSTYVVALAKTFACSSQKESDCCLGSVRQSFPS